MRKLYTIFLALVLTSSLYAQVPQKMSYQAVIRNSSDVLVANHAVGMKISILKDATPVYVETQTPTTNTNGLVTIEIGGGTPVTGTFAGIDWSDGTYSIKTETDPTGGTTYSIIGTSQLLSVPYALHAKSTSSDSTNQAEINALKQQINDLENIVYTQLPLPTNGLVAYYPFNGNANDASGNGNNGTVDGSILTNDRFGTANKAYSFDGINDFIEILHSSSLNFGTTPITISIWIQITNEQAGIVISKERTTAPDGSQLRIEIKTNPLRVAYAEGVNSEGMPRFLNTTSAISLNRWYHIIVVKEGLTYKLYLNGLLSDRLEVIAALDQTNNLNNITLGAESYITGTGKLQFSSVKIDDLRFYNRSLSDSEIKQLYNEGGYPNTLVTDIDGNKYSTVKIGTQTWMAENLKTTRFSDGTAIPLVNTNASWSALTNVSKAYCWANDNAANKDIYGALYTWAAAMNGAASSTANPSNVQGICPTGWHLPSDDEWTQMYNYLISSGYNYDGTTTGNKIAKALGSTSGWKVTSATGSAGSTDFPAKRNASGFTALPGGQRYNTGAFDFVGTEFGFWWSATDYDSTHAWYRYLYYSDTGAGRIYINEFKKGGYSVRCVKN